MNLAETSPSVTPIGAVRWRQFVRVKGRVRAVRVLPWEGSLATLECTLADETGGVTVVFTGRRRLGGVSLGTPMLVEGMVVASRGRLALLNPAYTLLPTSASVATC